MVEGYKILTVQFTAKDIAAIQPQRMGNLGFIAARLLAKRIWKKSG